MRDSIDKIGDAQFRVMCDMWGVDGAVKAAKRMGMAPTNEQMEAARQKEMAIQKRWNSVFRQKTKEDT